jgi:hypothetical protein
MSQFWTLKYTKIIRITEEDLNGKFQLI